MQEIFVFGAGQNTKRNWKDIIERYHVRYVLDNKEDLTGKNIEGVLIKEPEEVKKADGLPILVMPSNYKEIVNQLQAIGVPSSKIWIWKQEVKRKDFDYTTVEEIENVMALPQTDICDDWGGRRGTPIGRIYIDDFLKKNQKAIVGHVMEVGESTYSRRFGDKNKITEFTAIAPDEVGGCRKANLESGEGLYENEFDTMIITQTLAYIYDLKKTVMNIYSSLKKGGNCLVTVSDISHMGDIERERYGVFWGFHKDGVEQLFSDIFGENNVIVETYGNIKAAVAQLYGLSAEDLSEREIWTHDERYPVIIGIAAHKE